MANAHTQFEGLAPGTDKSGVPMLARRMDATGVASGVADGDWSLLQVDSNGYLKVAASVSLSSVDTELPAAGTLADGTSNPSTTSVGSLGLMYNGTTWDRVRGDTTFGVDVDVTRLPAAAVTTDSMAVSQQVNQLMNGNTALTPKFAAISASSSGNNTAIAAVASKTLYIHGMALVANAAVNVKFQSGAGGTDLTGLFYLAANTGFVLPFNPVGWFKCLAVNTLLNLNLSGAVAVGGCLIYTEV